MFSKAVIIGLVRPSAVTRFGRSIPRLTLKSMQVSAAAVRLSYRTSVRLDGASY